MNPEELKRKSLTWLREVQELDEDLCREIWSGYMEESRKNLAQVEAILQKSGDEEPLFDQLVGPIHTLKGNFANLGAEDGIGPLYIASQQWLAATRARQSDEFHRLRQEFLTLFHELESVE